MPGTYTISDIIRFFYPGFLLVLLAGISDKGHMAFLVASPVFAIAAALLVGIMFFHIYRKIYGLWLRHPDTPSKQFVSSYIKDKHGDALDIFPAQTIYDYFLMRSHEEDPTHSSNQNKLDSFVHLNFMTAMILIVGSIVYFLSEVYALSIAGDWSRPELFPGSLAFLLVGIFAAVNGFESDDKSAKRHEIYVRDNTERLDDILKNLSTNRKLVVEEP